MPAGKLTDKVIAALEDAAKEISGRYYTNLKQTITVKKWTHHPTSGFEKLH